MQLTNQQMQAALDYCEFQVNEGRIWVCLRFDDYCVKECQYNYGHQDYREFEQQVQRFLNDEYNRLHGTHFTEDGYLDAEAVIDWTDDNTSTNQWTEEVKQLRLRMIVWLREQYPVEQ